MEDIRSLTMGIIFTALCYTCVPIYLRFIKEKLYPNPKKICIKISIIVCIIDSILAIILDSKMNFTPAFIYYFVNMWILQAPRHLITSCTLCGKEIIKNEHNTCEECNGKILQRIAQKEYDKEIKSIEQEHIEKPEETSTKSNFCSQCGTKINEKDIFCSNCGNKLKG